MPTSDDSRGDLEVGAHTSRLVRRGAQAGIEAKGFANRQDPWSRAAHSSEMET